MAGLLGGGIQPLCLVEHHQGLVHIAQHVINLGGKGCVVDIMLGSELFSCQFKGLVVIAVVVGIYGK